MRRVECTTFSGIYSIDPVSCQPVYPNKQCHSNSLKREALIMELRERVDEKVDELLGRKQLVQGQRIDPVF